jgi:hypothetical protein
VKIMSWPTAVVVSVALLVMGTLTLLEADTSDLMLILLSLLGGMGAEQLRGLRENTNGTQAAILRELAETRRVLARVAGYTDTDGNSPPPNGGGLQTSSERGK